MATTAPDRATTPGPRSRRGAQPPARRSVYAAGALLLALALPATLTPPASGQASGRSDLTQAALVAAAPQPVAARARRAGRLRVAINPQPRTTIRSVARFPRAAKGRPVVVQQRQRKRWVTVARARQRRDGHAALTIPRRKAGRYAFRAVAARYRGRPVMQTRPVRVRVRRDPLSTVSAAAPVSLPGVDESRIRSQVVSGDGSTLALVEEDSGGGPGPLLVWRRGAPTPTQVALTQAQEVAIDGAGDTVAFRTEGAVIGGLTDYRLEVWRRDTGVVEAVTIPGATAPVFVSGVQLSEDGTRLAAAFSHPGADGGRTSGFLVHEVGSGGPSTVVRAMPRGTDQLDDMSADGTTFLFSRGNAYVRYDYAGNTVELLRVAPALGVPDPNGTLSADGTCAALTGRRAPGWPFNDRVESYRYDSVSGTYTPVTSGLGNRQAAQQTGSRPVISGDGSSVGLPGMVWRSGTGRSRLGLRGHDTPGWNLRGWSGDLGSVGFKAWGDDDAQLRVGIADLPRARNRRPAPWARRPDGG